MNWINELRHACEKHGQNKIAARIGYSSSTISQVLNGKYPSNLKAIQTQVEGVLMSQVVDCPVLGEITLDVCRGHQVRKLSTTNPMRVQMYRACRSNCPHSSVCKR